MKLYYERILREKADKPTIALLDQRIRNLIQQASSNESKMIST